MDGCFKGNYSWPLKVALELNKAYSTGRQSEAIALCLAVIEMHQFYLSNLLCTALLSKYLFFSHWVRESIQMETEWTQEIKI